MKIRIGDYWGAKYDRLMYLPKFLAFQIKENVRFEDMNQCKEIVLKRMYERHPDFLPKKDGLMMDIGSQYADWAIIAAKKYGTNVIGFEASKRNFDIALRNVSLNHLEDKVILNNLAIGNRNEKLEIAYDGQMSNAMGIGEKETVQMITLDGYPFIQMPDLIKIDIEGFELEALKGMEQTLLKYKPRIVIETHSWKLHDECGKFLYGLGYEMKERNPGRKGNDSFDWVQESFWSIE